MIRRFFEWVDGKLGLAGARNPKLDLTEVSKSMGEQLVNNEQRHFTATTPAESVLINGKRTYDPRVVEAVKRSRREELETRKHVLAAARPNYGTTTFRWHAGTTVRGSGDPRKDIADSRDRLFGTFPLEDYETGLSDEELLEHIEELKIQEAKHERRKAEHVARRRAEAETARKLARGPGRSRRARGNCAVGAGRG